MAGRHADNPAHSNTIARRQLRDVGIVGNPCGGTGTLGRLPGMVNTLLRCGDD
jgi:hypothetical protein